MTGAFFLCTVIRHMMEEVSHILYDRYKLHNETIKEKLVSICSQSWFSTNFSLDQCKYNWRAYSVPCGDSVSSFSLERIHGIARSSIRFTWTIAFFPLVYVTPFSSFSITCYFHSHSKLSNTAVGLDQ